MISLFITRFSLVTSLLFPFIQDDSVKKVDIKVTVKEIPVNYDSIFNARLDDKTGMEPYTYTPAEPKETYTPKKTYNTASKNLIAITRSKNTNELAVAESEDKTNMNNGEQPILIDPKTLSSVKTANSPEKVLADTLNSETGLTAVNAKQKDVVIQNNSVKEKLKSTFDPSSIKMGFDKLVYLWVGFILMLVGVIGGLIFNKNAFVISGIGVIFLLIGLYV